jgi:small subunit ribosomal protein S6e
MPPRLKLNITDSKNRKSEPLLLDGSQAAPFIGLKIGDIVDGSLIGRPGERFKITGGADISGFPMIQGLRGSVKKYMLLDHGKGQKKYPKGYRVKKMVRGEMISEDTAQVNLIKVD